LGIDKGDLSECGPENYSQNKVTFHKKIEFKISLLHDLHCSVDEKAILYSDLKSFGIKVHVGYQLHVSESEHENTTFFLKRADKRNTLNFG